jgi:hypothetical protein
VFRIAVRVESIISNARCWRRPFQVVAKVKMDKDLGAEADGGGIEEWRNLTFWTVTRIYGEY